MANKVRLGALPPTLSTASVLPGLANRLTRTTGVARSSIDVATQSKLEADAATLEAQAVRLIAAGAETNSAAALANASAAMAAAGSKNRIMEITEVATPYIVGDLVRNPGGYVIKCITSRASGPVVESDWEPWIIRADYVKANISMESPFITGGVITGGTITGATLQTAASSLRVAISSAVRGAVQFFGDVAAWGVERLNGQLISIDNAFPTSFSRGLKLEAIADSGQALAVVEELWTDVLGKANRVFAVAKRLSSAAELDLTSYENSDTSYAYLRAGGHFINISSDTGVQTNSFESGQVTVATTPNVLAQQWVPFTRTYFGVAPAVVCTPRASVPDQLHVSVTGVTTSGFNLYVKTTASSATVMWMATTM